MKGLRAPGVANTLNNLGTAGAESWKTCVQPETLLHWQGFWQTLTYMSISPTAYCTYCTVLCTHDNTSTCYSCAVDPPAPWRSALGYLHECICQTYFCFHAGLNAELMFTGKAADKVSLRQCLQTWWMQESLCHKSADPLKGIGQCVSIHRRRKDRPVNHPCSFWLWSLKPAEGASLLVLLILILFLSSPATGNCGCRN